MTRTLLFTLSTLALLGSLTRAAAADTTERIVVIPSGAEPSCLDVAATARAIERHAGLSAVVVDADMFVDLDVLTVRLSARAGLAQIAVRRGNHTIDSELAIEPCDGLTEQIAAFVAGSIAALVEAPVPITSRAEEDRSLRAAILAGVWRDGFHHTWGTYAAVASLSLGAYSLGFLAVADGLEDPSARTVTRIAAAVAAAGAVTPFVLGTSDRAEPLSRTSHMIATALTVLAVGEDRGDLGISLMGASILGTGVLYGIATMIEPRRAPWRRGKFRGVLADRRARESLSDAQLDEIENDVRAASYPVPRWLRPLPFVVASVAALGQLSEEHAGPKDSLLATMVSNALAAALYTIPTPIEKVAQRMEAAGLQLGALPTPEGGLLSLSGTF